MMEKTLSTIVAVVVAAVSSVYVKQSLGSLALAGAPRVENINKPLDRIAFGSCNDQSFPQPMWKNIAAHEPELWLWMGDNWEWLENELLTTTAAFNVIVSGIQILPADRYPVAECWGRFPNQRERLLKLILTANAKGVILLSGDVHFSEINQVICSNGANTITEITSSGMTHSWMEFHAPSMQYVMALMFTYANLVLPWEFRPTQDSFYGHLNWGSIDFDWSHDPHPVAVVKVRGQDDNVKVQYTFESTAMHSESPEQDAVDCRAPRQIKPWKRIMLECVFVAMVAICLLCVPLNAVILLWLLWFFVKKAYALARPGSKKLPAEDAEEHSTDSKKSK
ncbi:hypothetical protein BBJ28_00015396 [Nothophytophthora sp. Chile5]|nr:hypothetical protein BBJ28_00015396 [Nothophytophthora sp. Chile5]